jgi:hypothetical protein
MAQLVAQAAVAVQRQVRDLRHMDKALAVQAIHRAHHHHKAAQAVMDQTPDLAKVVAVVADHPQMVQLSAVHSTQQLKVAMAAMAHPIQSQGQRLSMLVAVVAVHTISQALVQAAAVMERKLAELDQQSAQIIAAVVAVADMQALEPMVDLA